MTVTEKKPVPIYEVTCFECKSKIQYKKSEVFTCHIQCPVCGISLWADTVQPVRYIDAEPVKHGRWIDPAAEDCYRCSVCEEYTQMEMPRLLYHFCPNCGADMRTEEGE